MADKAPIGPPMVSVVRTARTLVARAREEPALLSRPVPDCRTAGAAWELPSLLPWRPGAMAAGSSGGLVHDAAYLEELISLAAESAHRTEDASRQASEAGLAIRRGRLACAMLGVAGLAIGLAGAVGSVVNAEHRQAQVARELATVKTLQRQADDRLAAVLSVPIHAAPVAQTAATPLPRLTPTAGTPLPLPRLTAIPVATRPEWSVPPAPGPVREEPATRPNRYRAVRRTRVHVVTPPVIVARFMTNLQRDLGYLFR